MSAENEGPDSPQIARAKAESAARLAALRQAQATNFPEWYTGDLEHRYHVAEREVIDETLAAKLAALRSTRTVRVRQSRRGAKAHLRAPPGRGAPPASSAEPETASEESA